MNILLSHVIIFLEKHGSDPIDIISWVEAIVSILTLALGVVTIFIGKKIITTKRENAKYGFYINFLAYIERLQSLFSEYPYITTYLVKQEIRQEEFLSAPEETVAERVIPVLISWCDDFLVFISSAENNVVPEHWKNSRNTEEQEWEMWYDNIKTIILYTQKCKLLERKLTPYFSKTQIEGFKQEYHEFSASLEYISTELKKAIAHPGKRKREEKR